MAELDLLTTATADSAELSVLAEIARIATQDLEFRPMLERITDALQARLGCELVSLVGLDLESRRFVCEALTSSVPTTLAVGQGRDFGSGVVGAVASLGCAIVVDDAWEHPDFVEVFPGTRSELCLPVRHRGEIVALLNLESSRPGAFASLLPLGQAIADQIAGAIASARLFEATRRRAFDLEVLSEVSRAAVGSSDIADGLFQIVSYLQRRFDFFLASIVIPDASQSTWAHRAFATRDPSGPMHDWPLGAGVVGRTIRTDEPQLVLDVATDPDYFSTSPEVRAEYARPIRFGDRTLAVLNLESERPSDFSPENVRLFDLVADQVAGALEMALLNEQISETKRQLEEVNRDLHRANRSLQKLSEADPLTGLSNRRHLDRALAVEWRRHRRSRLPLSLLVVDVDHFKAYNDALGHAAGDDCLRALAGVLRAVAARAGDLVARYGGEEFVVLLAGTDAGGAHHLAERIRERLAAAALPHPASPSAATVTVSIGAATALPEPRRDVQELFAAADAALYRAKQGGRDRIVAADG